MKGLRVALAFPSNQLHKEFDISEGCEQHTTGIGVAMKGFRMRYEGTIWRETMNLERKIENGEPVSEW